MNGQSKNTSNGEGDPKDFAAVKKKDECSECKVFYNSYPTRLRGRREGNFGFAVEESFRDALHWQTRE